MILTRKIAAGVAGVAVAGVLGTAGVAAATSDSSSAPASGPAAAGVAAPSASGTPGGSAGPASSTRPKGHHRAAGWRLLARGMHGEWVVKGKDGKPVTLVSVRGTVTALGSGSITVEAEDGFTATFATTADTKVRGGADALGQVKVGAKAAVVGVKSGGTTTARAIIVRK